MLKAYRIHAGEPQDAAALVFAESFRQAKVLGFNSCACEGCDYTDVRGDHIKNDGWLKANAADQEKLTKGVPHVIDGPPSCEDCELWYDELFGGLCESCSEEAGG